MELILVRHSITQGNLERRFIGRTDQPLVPQGEQLAARRAAGIPAVEHVFVSPLQRCRRTADILWPHVEHTVLEGLRETDFGDWEGMSGDELEAHPRFQAWLAQGCEGDLPTMETREQCAARAGRAWNRSSPMAGPTALPRWGWPPTGAPSWPCCGPLPSRSGSTTTGSPPTAAAGGCAWGRGALSHPDRPPGVPVTAGAEEFSEKNVKK